MLAHAALLLLQATAPTVAIPAGSYTPLYGSVGDAPMHVDAFRLDRDPVSRGAYLEFVRRNPQWRRSAVRPVYASRAYLADWRDDFDAGNEQELGRPVSGVSWFAARAFCSSHGGRLPRMAEWEYVASANANKRDAARDPRFVQALVSLYATRSTPRPQAAVADVNAFGVRGLHGVGWEWVEDFNSVLVSDDSRGIGAADHDMFCASAAIGAVDPRNYPAFLRHAVRAGLNGRSTLGTLGFRCAA